MASLAASIVGEIVTACPAVQQHNVQVPVTVAALDSLSCDGLPCLRLLSALQNAHFSQPISLRGSMHCQPLLGSQRLAP